MEGETEAALCHDLALLQARDAETETLEGEAATSTVKRLNDANSGLDFKALPSEITDMLAALAYLESQHWLSTRILRMLASDRHCTALALEGYHPSIFLAFEDLADRKWTNLTCLDISNIPMKEVHIELVASLPRLSELAIVSCSITLMEVAHLMKMGNRLTILDVSCNEGIDDTCLPMFAFLPFLRILRVDETSTTVTGLRSYAQTAESLRRFPRTKVTVPLSCAEYLESAQRSQYYAFSLNDPYLLVETPDKAANLSDQGILENLRYHSIISKRPFVREEETPAHRREALNQLLQIRLDDLLLLKYADLSHNTDNNAIQTESQ